MGMQRIVIRAAFLACVALQASARAAAEEPAAPLVPTAEGFAAGLAKVRDLVGDTKAAPAQALFDKLLQEHRGADHVRAKRVELEDLVGRIAFGKACPPPKPQDVVRGKLMTYGVAFSTTAPRLKVAYTGGAPHDFERMSELLVHPADFKGGFSVLITGSSYPRKVDDSPVVAFGLEEHPKTGKVQAYQVVCGVPPYDEGRNTVWLPAVLGHLDGEDQEILKKLEPPAITAGGSFKLLVKVTDETFSYSANGKAMGSAPKARGMFGRVAFKIPTWDRVELEGVVEPSWIQGRIDALVQERRKAFFADFDVKRHLPAWIYEGGAAAGATPAPGGDGKGALPFGEALPEQPDLKGRLRVLLVMTQLLTGQAEAAAKTLRESDGLPASVRAWLQAQIDVERSAMPEALVALDRTLELAPTFGPARILRGRVLHGLGRSDEAEKALRAVAQEHPADPEVAQAVALNLLFADRQDAARAVLEEVARRGLRSERLDALARALVKVQRGPEWRRVFEHETANYRVVSDIDQAICATAARILEEALAVYRVHLKALPKADARKYPVYLFSGQAGFQAYMAESEFFGSGGHEHVAGVYSPLLKQLLIWNLPEREEMLQTVRHEGFHQYLDRALTDPPVWFNEGLAVYYENLTNTHGAVKHGNLHRDLIEILRTEGLPPVSRLLADGPRAFYARGRASYAHAWLFVHMLRHGTPAHKSLFETLLARLATASANDAVRAVLPADTLPALDRDLTAYLAGIDAKR
jgi:tetratricopeptide (TPR) repeat protein